MLKFLKNMLTSKPSADFKSLIENGAVLIDVRSKAEFASGHVKNALNIPLPNLQNGIQSISKNKVIITCCASGMRSGLAKTELTRAGFEHVFNGGSWQSITKQLSA